MTPPQREAAVAKTQRHRIEHLSGERHQHQGAEQHAYPRQPLAHPAEQTPARRHAEQIDQHEIAVGVADQLIERQSQPDDESDAEQTDGEHQTERPQRRAARGEHGQRWGSSPSRAMLQISRAKP